MSAKLKPSKQDIRKLAVHARLSLKVASYLSDKDELGDAIWAAKRGVNRSHELLAALIERRSNYEKQLDRR